MSTNKRIAIVTRTMGCGGAETVMLNLGKYLNENGFGVEIVTTGDPGDWFERIAEKGMKGRHIYGRHRFHHLVHSFRVGRELISRGYKVIILSNSERWAHAAINMLPDDVVVIPWIHSDEADAYKKALINKGAWNVAVGVSRKVAETVTLMARPRPVRHISNGIDPPTNEAWHGRRDWGHPLRLIFVGRIDERSKGVLFLPKIMLECQKRNLTVMLDIIGDGPDLNGLKSKTRAMGVQDKIRFFGVLNHFRVYDQLLESHALLMPSFFEGLPTAPLEAQVCGCVPIASRLEGITDVAINDRRTGFLVDVGDIEGFVNRVEKLYSDPEGWRKMSEAGHKKVIGEFSVEKMGQSFAQLISEAISGHYPLSHPRRKYLPVNPKAFTWKEHIPRWIHRLGLGNLLRKAFAPRLS